MNENDKRIIIREIQYWRKNKLLPEQYCQYLYNLYTAGGDEEPEKVPLRKKISPVIFAFLGSLALIVSSYVIFHFTRFPFWMQILLLIMGIFLAYSLSYYHNGRNQGVTDIWLGVASVLLLQGGTFVLSALHFPEKALLLYALFCSLFWLATSYLTGRTFLAICGLLGISTSYAFLILPVWEGGGIPILGQIIWVPLVIAMFHCGRWAKKRGDYRSSYYFIFAVLMAFAPEIQGLYVPVVTTEYIQIFLFAKLIGFSIIFIILLRGKSNKSDKHFESR